LTLPDDVVRWIIGRYTREAGVRQLERAIGSVGRKIALKFAENGATNVVIRVDDLADLLGPERFFLEKAREQMPAGVATGLAWTETGGEVLYVEASLLPHSRGLKLTGQLGNVMRESAFAARSFLWSHAEQFGIDVDRFRRAGVHVHVPAGAVPKDGPSAGVAMVVALTSLYTGQPTRIDTAMTGEITLTGLVLPVGGIKEKVLAAHRAGLRRVILPKPNDKDLRQLPEQVREDMDFVLAERIEEALAAAIPELERAMPASSK
jgi:ATP-dependent Lon protease